MWVLADTTHLDDINIPHAPVGYKLSYFMVGAEEIAGPLGEREDFEEPTILEGRVREERFKRFLCDTESHGAIPLLVHSPQALFPGDHFQLDVRMQLLWGYEAEFFPECPRPYWKVRAHRPHQKDAGLVWLDLEQQAG